MSESARSAVMNKVAATYKSPLHEMTQTTPTCLWNDSASVQELTYSIEHGAVGATCNPVIVLGVLKKEMHLWKDRIRQLLEEMPVATENQIGWKLVEEISANGANLLRPIFERHKGKNGRLSIQTDPRFYRNTNAILEQALRAGGETFAEIAARLREAMAGRVTTDSAELIRADRDRGWT